MNLFRILPVALAALLPLSLLADTVNADGVRSLTWTAYDPDAGTAAFTYTLAKTLGEQDELGAFKVTTATVLGGATKPAGTVTMANGVGTVRGLPTNGTSLFLLGIEDAGEAADVVYCGAVPVGTVPSASDISQMETKEISKSILQSSAGLKVTFGTYFGLTIFLAIPNSDMYNGHVSWFNNAGTFPVTPPEPISANIGGNSYWLYIWDTDFSAEQALTLKWM